MTEVLRDQFLEQRSSVMEVKPLQKITRKRKTKQKKEKREML